MDLLELLDDIQAVPSTFCKRPIKQVGIVRRFLAILPVENYSIDSALFDQPSR